MTVWEDRYAASPESITGESDCEHGEHPAWPSHDSRYGQGLIWGATCPADGLTTYITEDALTHRPA